MRCASGILVLLLALSQAARAQFPDGEVVDLSHPFDERTLFWPTEERGFVLEKVAEGVTEQGHYYAANRFCSAEHGGTHIDAPIHFFRGRNTVDMIPLGQLMGEAILVDVSPKCAGNADYQVQASDFQEWEKRHGRMPADAIVLLRTGYGQYWPDRKRYLGTEERGAGAVARLHFPGLDPEAAKWLLANRPIKAIGLDTASIDYGQSTRFGSHVALCEKNVPAFENVANLDRLPARGFRVIALPMKIKGGSGAPLRIIAIVKR
jgi:kynurenine formamidase